MNIRSARLKKRGKERKRERERDKERKKNQRGLELRGGRSGNARACVEMSSGRRKRKETYSFRILQRASQRLTIRGANYNPKFLPRGSYFEVLSRALSHRQILTPSQSERDPNVRRDRHSQKRCDTGHKRDNGTIRRKREPVHRRVNVAIRYDCSPSSIST